MIDDAIQLTKECGKSVAVSQDEDGNVQVAKFPHDDSDDNSRAYVCWAAVSDDEDLQENEVGLVDNVEYEDYTIEQMVPRVRDALTKDIGIWETGVPV